MKDNRGFTLIELIVVMIIAGIVAVGSMVGYNLLNTGGAQSTMERISTMLDYVQLQNLTKSKMYNLVIHADADGYYYLSIESVDSAGASHVELQDEKLEIKNRGAITVLYKDGSEYLVSALPMTGKNTTERFKVGFTRETGGFKPLEGRLVTQIGISTSGRSYTIHLVEVTGKHYVE